MPLGAHPIFQHPPRVARKAEGDVFQRHASHTRDEDRRGTKARFLSDRLGFSIVNQLAAAKMRVIASAQKKYGTKPTALTPYNASICWTGKA
jgi:hypothetical protein